MTMAATSTHEPNAILPQVSGRVRIARFAYLISIVLFAAGIVVQVFFAGATLLVDSDYLIQHRSFAHTLELLTFVVPIIGLFARLPWRLLLLSWLPLGLFLLQYVFLYAVPSLGLATSLRALHAVNALVIFWVTLSLAKSAWRLARAA